ncbi:MAG TPA: chemotaxis protein CheB [Gemmatimonadaceae bacterium]|nr:chemotaxis protein CheB [Gemmatimonadaceae bacterium]
MPTRDIIVVGASMGGVEALSTLVGQLPADLPATVLIVQHTSAQFPSYLGRILSQRGKLTVMVAEDRMPLVHGRIYVAPPDRHLLLTAEGLRVIYGPRENRVRPAIDPLFRTAAVHCRGRVIGVILTGLLGDGASGLLAVYRCGGATIVQSPNDAAYAEMPTRALAAVPTAHEVTLAELAPMLVRLAAQEAPPSPPVPEALRIEARFTERARANDDWGDIPTRATDFTCPECSGAVREIEGEPIRRYRCRVGHAYSQQDFVAAKESATREALWLALQTFQEQAQILESLADEDSRRGWMRNAFGYEERAQEMRAAAERLRELVARLAD